jgi:hypothetical protein
MAILNEQLSWNEVGAIETGGGGRVRDAFQLMFGNPTKELLPIGMSIYKFNAYNTLGQARSPMRRRCRRGGARRCRSSTTPA